MNAPHDSQEKLAREIHQALRSLPARRAPSSLAGRVLAEIERREALPWWRRSFIHWPAAAQVAFVALSLVLVRYAFAFGSWVLDGFEGIRFREAAAAPLAWFDKGSTVVDAIGGFLEIMNRTLPPLWLYGGLALFAAAYVTLLGLGAAAYKALHAQR